MRVPQYLIREADIAVCIDYNPSETYEARKLSAFTTAIAELRNEKADPRLVHYLEQGLSDFKAAKEAKEAREATFATVTAAVLAIHAEAEAKIASMLAANGVVRGGPEGEMIQQRFVHNLRTAYGAESIRDTLKFI